MPQCGNIPVRRPGSQLLRGKLAGGFDNLERGGRHRAPIFRKVRRFRATYGAHPDEFVFPWIQLDLDTAWSEQISRQIKATRSRGGLG